MIEELELALAEYDAGDPLFDLPTLVHAARYWQLVLNMPLWWALQRIKYQGSLEWRIYDLAQDDILGTGGSPEAAIEQALRSIEER